MQAARAEGDGVDDSEAVNEAKGLYRAGSLLLYFACIQKKSLYYIIAARTLK